MRALVFLAALIPALVLAQPIPRSGVSSTGALGSGLCLSLSTGQKYCSNGTNAGKWTTASGTSLLTLSALGVLRVTSDLRFDGASLTSGAGAATTWTLTNSASTGLVIVPTTQLTSGTLFEIDNPSATFAMKVSWDKNLTIGNHIIATGDIYSGSGFFNVNGSNTGAVFASKINDAVSAVAHKFSSQNSLTAGNDRYIAYFYRDDRTNLMASIDTSGRAIFNGGVAFSSGGTAVTKHLTTTSVIDFASTSSTCITSSGITLTGAVLGDRCEVGFSQDLSAINGSFTCQVTATDTAKVKFCSGAATQDPASTTFTVEAWH